MNGIKPGILDRIEYCGVFFKKHGIDIILPVLFYLFVTHIIIGSILGFIFMGFIDIQGIVNNPDSTFLSLFTDSSFVILIAVSIFLFLLYLLLIIPFSVAGIKAIKNGFDEKQNTLIENITYGFQVFFKTLSVYWYIFAYVALIPCLILIAGGLLVLAGQWYDIEMLLRLGGLIVGTASFLLFIFMMYRGIKTSFSLYHAIDTESFDQKEFNNSILFTNDRWWRIVGNFLAMGIIIGLLSSMITPFLDTIFFLLGGGTSKDFVDIAFQNNENIDPNELGTLLDSMKQFSFLSKIHDTISLILSNIFSSFMVLFGYVFYYSLKKETQLNNIS